MIRKALLAAALAAPMILASQAAIAQAAGAWRYSGAIYLYLPTISGTTTFPHSTAGSDVSVDPDQVLGNLNGAFMGALEAHNGRWGLFTDLIYMGIDGSKSGSREFSVGRHALPAGASANVNLDLTGTVWTLGGSYRVLTSPRGTMDLLAGARLVDLDLTTSWTLNGNIASLPLPTHAGNRSTGASNWDGIIGLKGRIALGDDKKWFAPYYLDVGTGDSDRTVQAMAGVGYGFSWGEVVGLWRYLDYKLNSGTPVESVNFSGPALAAVWHW